MELMKRKKGLRRVNGDVVFDTICTILLIFCVVIVAYPLWFVVVASFSDPIYVNNGTFLLWPKGFNVNGYIKVFEDKQLWTGYFNTIIYTVGGTSLGTAIVLLAGYAFSRNDLPGNGIIMKLFVFTMYFGGGTIPLYLVIKNLRLLDTRAILIILGSVSVYNIIIVRSFMASSIPQELFEAATIDGCGNGYFFVKVVVPLSKAIIAVIALYIAVAHWNSYFNALMYLLDEAKRPLQIYLRDVLLSVNIASNDQSLDSESIMALQEAVQLIKYSSIIVATGPILCVYPFIQKYFVKGVMIGSIKG